MDFDVIIIGAGASGLMCAAQAGKRGRAVAMLDHNAKPGAKISVSGGGRCNFTNRAVEARHYLSGNPDFCKSALKRFTPDDFLNILKRHRIGFEEKERGQLFCTSGAAAITGMMEKECRNHQVRFFMNQKILSVAKKTRFRVRTDMAEYTAESLVIATGGLSWPKLGASDFGYRIARQFGLEVTPLRPGLTPLLFGDQFQCKFKTLSGVSFYARVGTGNIQFEGDALFTHQGLSGPAVMQISNYWRPTEPVVFDLLPGRRLQDEVNHCGRKNISLLTLLSYLLPKRFVNVLFSDLDLTKPLSSYPAEALQEADCRLHSWSVPPVKQAGYRIAEVTAGGVDARGLSSRTMECRTVPGLFFTGEVLDVTGQLGGYNLHWAWASGHAAGQYV